MSVDAVALAPPATPRRRRWGRAAPWAGLLAALGVLLWTALSVGAVPIAWSDLLDPATREGAAHVLVELRLPRALGAMLVGAMLALGGALAQGLFRNPLADPGLLGVTSGAACAAALTIVVFASWPLLLQREARPYALPMAAFVGALLVCLLLDRVARWLVPGSVAALLLTGVALNALAAAVIGLSTYLATDEQLRSLSFWTLGSLAGTAWPAVAGLAVATLVALTGVGRLARGLNALALGEAAAAHVGVAVASLRRAVILRVALLCGLAVAACGLIGFVGLVAPHLARLWRGPDQRDVIPVGMAIGALLLLAADTLSRTVAIPAEVPVGIFTALLGGPFFLALLARGRERVA